MPLRIAYFGQAPFGRDVLVRLLEAGHEIAGVYAPPTKPGGKNDPLAEEAEKRTGLPTFHVGQRVQGMFGCVACQFQIRNRGPLPTCPQCGEIIWAYLESGPRPVPEGDEPGQAPAPSATPQTSTEEGVKLDAPQSVTVTEGVKLNP